MCRKAYKEEEGGGGILLMRRQLPSAPETLFLLRHLSFDPPFSYIIHPLPKPSPYVKRRVFPCFSSNFFASFHRLILFLRRPFFLSKGPGSSANGDNNGERSTRAERQGRGLGGRRLNVCLCLIGPQMSQRPSQITVCPGRSRGRARRKERR